MSRWYRTDLILVGLLFFVMAGPSVFAQNPDMGMGGGMGRGGKHAENLDNLRMLKLLEVLDLNEDQNAEFIATYAAFRKEMKEIRKETESEVDQLIELLKNDTPDEDQINEKLDKIQKLKERFTANFDNLRIKAKEILTTIQYAKMVVFQERFERELIKSVRGFRGDKPADGRI